MTAILHLLRIETRRSEGLWIFPLMVFLVWFAALWWRPDLVANVVPLWAEMNIGVQNGAVFLGPLAAGLGAWAASRNRRRSMDDLLATMPRSAIGQDFAVLAGPAAWVLIAYVAAAAVLMGYAFVQTPWGAPDGLRLLVGLTSITAMYAMGFAVGRFSPSRFVAPMVTIGVFVVLALVLSLGRGTVYAFLSPVDETRTNVFRALQESQGVPQILWFAGLTAVALAVVALRRRVSLAAVGTLAVALAVSGMGASQIVASDFVPVSQRERVPFDPVCAEGSFPVCVHPAFQGVLAGVAETLQGIVASVEGFPGVPVRAVQGELGDRNVVDPDGTVYFELIHEHPASPDPPRRWRSQASSLAGLLVTGSGSAEAPRVPSSLRCSAQGVIEAWLMMQAGLGLDILSPMERAAVEEFAALSPEAQRAWLEANWTALRAGRLALSALPVAVDTSACFTGS